MAKLVRHRQPKGPDTNRPSLNHRATPRLYNSDQVIRYGVPRTDFIKVYLPAAFPIVGIGLYCGLWARNSGRDFWLWFTAGLVFSIFALIAVLDAHEKDQKAKRDAAKKASKEALDL